MAENKKDIEEMTLEEMFDRLDGILGELNKDENSLEKSFELYKEGITLLKDCGSKIDEVEKKVLVISSNGELDEYE
ncbi:MAG: exodeoxyribonuclease VII small subunit [Lachnospiraceae bacterium]|nr:exodeoxyribonuclease VII small subunit [Lachnospiraceae bacterium]